MKIEIIGAESMGVRSLCCFVETGKRRVLIDPGVALDKMRHRLLPHPVQVAAMEEVRQKIVDRWPLATDIVISHFHGDHTPLRYADAYQLKAKKVTGFGKDLPIWTKGINNLSSLEKERFLTLPPEMTRGIRNAEGKEGPTLSFSEPVPHGDQESSKVTVLMTRVREGDFTFVHCSDIQLLNEKSVAIVRSWKPTVAILSGPPLYISRITAEQRQRAFENGVKLSASIETLIIDHHLLRNLEGFAFLKRISSETGNRVISAAAFMKRAPLPLEALRKKLYSRVPVPERWHKDYRTGRASTRPFKEWLKSSATGFVAEQGLN